jgi:hypothetical protein
MGKISPLCSEIPRSETVEPLFAAFAHLKMCNSHTRYGGCRGKRVRRVARGGSRAGSHLAGLPRRVDAGLA